MPPAPVNTVRTWRSALRESYGINKPLDFYVVALWMHGFFWGMDDADRLLMLAGVYGIDVPEGAIRQTILALGLKGWEDFPDAYTRAPFSVELIDPE
jgi:hypothetical protein